MIGRRRARCAARRERRGAWLSTDRTGTPVGWAEALVSRLTCDVVSLSRLGGASRTRLVVRLISMAHADLAEQLGSHDAFIRAVQPDRVARDEQAGRRCAEVSVHRPKTRPSCPAGASSNLTARAECPWRCFFERRPMSRHSTAIPKKQSSRPPSTASPSVSGLRGVVDGPATIVAGSMTAWTPPADNTAARRTSTIPPVIHRAVRRGGATFWSCPEASDADRTGKMSVPPYSLPPSCCPDGLLVRLPQRTVTPGDSTREPASRARRSGSADAEGVGCAADR